jgi:hypothetical protein
VFNPTDCRTTALILKIRNPALINKRDNELDNWDITKKKPPHNSDTKAGKKKVFVQLA